MKGKHWENEAKHDFFGITSCFFEKKCVSLRHDNEMASRDGLNVEPTEPCIPATVEKRMRVELLTKI